jgi:hypothetical protein
MAVLHTVSIRPRAVPYLSRIHGFKSPIYILYWRSHQYSHNFLVGVCTSSKSWKSASKTSYVQFSTSLVSFRPTSYHKPTRRQIKKFKSWDNHIKCVYYTHGLPSLSSPALVIATHHCHRRPPLLLSPALIVTAHPCCCRLPSLSPPALVVTPTLIIAALVVTPTLIIAAHPHCCCPPALIIAASTSHL